MGNKPSSSRGSQPLSRARTIPEAGTASRGDDAMATRKDARNPLYLSDDQFLDAVRRQNELPPEQPWQLKARPRSLDLTANYANDTVNMAPSADAETGAGPDFSKPPRTRPIDTFSGSMMGGYFRSLDNLIHLWPEYRALNDLKPDRLKPAVAQNLQAVYQRVYEQHSMIIEQQKATQQTKQELQEMDEERYSISQLLRARDSEIEALQNDVRFMEGEFKKRGIDVAIPDKSNFRSRKMSEMDGNIGETDDKKSTVLAEKFRQKAQQGFVMATPLLQAEGKRMSSVFEKQSARTDSMSGEQGESRGTEDLNDRLVRMQKELERERRQNEILQLRIDKSEPLSPSVIEGRNSEARKLTERYRKLRHYAITKIVTVLYANIGHADQSRIHSFIVAIVEKSYSICDRTISQFNARVKALLINPARGSEEGVTTHKTPKQPARSASFMKNVKLFDFQPEALHSRLALRTMSAAQVPQALLSEINNFLQFISPMTNLSSLIEDLVDTLSREYPDCTTPALLNQSIFNSFLHDVMRLTWQMNVLVPPMHVASNPLSRLDEQYHEAHLSQNVTNAAIAYHLWPLLSDRTNGEVLVKALVFLET